MVATPLKVMAGAVTVAVMTRLPPGVTKLEPGGSPTVICEVPAAAGSNVTFLKVSPGLKVAGEPTIVPTLLPPVG